MRLLFAAASLVVVVTGLVLGASLLIPIVISTFLALLTFPLVYWLMKHRVPPSVAVLLTVLSGIGVLMGPSSLIGVTLAQFQQALPGYRSQLDALLGRTEEWLRQLSVGQFSLDIDYVVNLIDPAVVARFAGSTVSDIVSLFSSGFVVLLVVAFMLANSAQVLARADGALRDSSGYAARIIGEVQTYLVVKTGVSLATGLTAWSWLTILGVDFAMLWGLTAFLLNYIPTLGSIVAAVPPALLALLQFGPSTALLVLVGYFAMNMFFGNFVEPHLMGRHLKISPLVVLLSVLVWGWIWGVAGALMAVPMTMVLKIGLENSKEFNWIAKWIEGQPVEPASQS